MRALKIGLFTLAGLVGVLVGIGLLLPSSWQVRRSVIINAPPAVLYPLVANLKTGWVQWSAFDGQDADIQYRYEGPDMGVGAARSWVSKRMGDGAQRIVQADPASGVEFELRMANGFAMRGTVAFEPATGAANATQVTWTDSGDVGMNLVYRYGVAIMDRMMGGTFERSLATLKAKAEAGK